MSSIHTTIYQTMSDIEKWNDVLKAFITATGASKGIITLRDRATADLVIPEDVRQELASPLVYGFTEEEIYSYITDYMYYDPWTTTENLYHPEDPYALSQHTDEKALKESKFWEWLEPQNISDTAIIKIGDSSSNYWVAMNLYFPQDSLIKSNTINYLEQYKHDIQTAWQLGQNYRLKDISSGYTDYFLGLDKHPILIIDNNATVLKMNDAATKLIDESTLINTSESQSLLIDQVNLEKELKANLNKSTKGLSTPFITEFSNSEYSYSLSLISPPENILGEETGKFKLVIRDNAGTADKKSWDYFWYLCNLTKRERQLIEILGKGERVVDFQTHYGIAKATAHMHWQNVKSKTGVKDRAEISFAYQTFINADRPPILTAV